MGWLLVDFPGCPWLPRSRPRKSNGDTLPQGRAHRRPSQQQQATAACLLQVLTVPNGLQFLAPTDMHSELVEPFFTVSIGTARTIEAVSSPTASSAPLTYHGVAVDVGKGPSFGLGLGSTSSIPEGRTVPSSFTHSQGGPPPKRCTTTTTSDEPHKMRAALLHLNHAAAEDQTTEYLPDVVSFPRNLVGGLGCPPALP